jgi:chemotaxis methyl-accepting protein methylase
MKRNIVITLDESSKDPNAVHVNNINTIVNYSCDSVGVNCLEYLSEQDHTTVLSHLLNKLRPHGRLVIKANNSLDIASRFLQRSISHQDFLRFFANKQSLISIESIYTLINFTEFDLVDLDITNDNVKIVLERKTV